MARKDAIRDAPTSGDLRDELERLGVAPDASGPLADRLRGLARALTSTEMRALLDLSDAERDAGGPSAVEMTNILEDFASELKKLDEGLRVLTAYLSRLRDRQVAPARTLH
jgi:hypothetical protein